MKIDIRCYAMVLLLFSGCSVSRDILTPKLPYPEKFRNSPLQSDSATVVDIHWKDFYKDPVLQGLIDSALVKNYDMQIALKKLEESAIALSQSRWNNIPELGLSINGSSNRPSENSFTALSLQQFNAGSKHIEDYSARFEFSWEADIWGKIKSQNKSALASFLMGQEARKLIQTDIIASVSQGYYNLLMLDAQLEIAQKNVGLTQNTLKIVELQFRAGQVTNLAVQQTKVLRQAAELLVPQFEQRILIQENALRLLTGQLPDKINRTSTLSQLNENPDFSLGIPSQVLSSRPDVRSAELALMGANADVGIAKGNMYPSLKITASGGLNAFEASNWFNLPASLFGLAAGNIAQPIFSHKRLRANYEISKVKREQTVIAFRQSVLQAVKEVSDALVYIEKLDVQTRIASERVGVLQQATENADKLFKNGMANYLEVISAQGNVLKGELDLAELKKAELTAYSDLYRSLGGGWQ
jgi:multidrug efflux system outer membrane protein